MKILYVTSKTPLPINDGHALRSYNLLKAAAGRHDVTLLSCVKYPVEYRHKDELEQICASVKQFEVPDNGSQFRAGLTAVKNLCGRKPYVAQKYDLPALRNEMRRLLSSRRFDLVHLDMLPLGVYLDEIRVPTVLNEHNVESVLLGRRVEATGNPLIGSYLKIQQVRLERFEAGAVSGVRHVVCCSEEDRSLLLGMSPGARVTVVPNGVDTESYAPGGSTAEIPGRLVFVGGMNWFPNLDAVNWFDRAICPELETRSTGIKLDVVGKAAPPPKLSNSESITMHGFVSDVRPYLERASVMVVPIRVGGGTRLKVLEAMSMGKAIVSTRVGAEGIGVEHRRDMLLADTPAEFAECIVELLRDGELRRRLGRGARELVLSRYRWSAIGERLLGVYEEATSA